MLQGDNSSKASANIIDLNRKLIACCQDQKKLLGLLLSSVHVIVFQLNSLSLQQVIPFSTCLREVFPQNPLWCTASLFHAL